MKRARAVNGVCVWKIRRFINIESVEKENAFIFLGKIARKNKRV